MNDNGISSVQPSTGTQPEMILPSGSAEWEKRVGLLEIPGEKPSERSMGDEHGAPRKRFVSMATFIPRVGARAPVSSNRQGMQETPPIPSNQKFPKGAKRRS